MKTGLPHLVHLSDLAIEVLANCPRTGKFVFSTTGSTAVSGFPKAKKRLDAAVPIPPWVLHDFRRTIVDGLCALGVQPFVCDKILAHSGGAISGVAKRYNHFAFIDERRAALDAWGRHVAGLIGRDGDAVDALGRKIA
jgi:hypothetical protein